MPGQAENRKLHSGRKEEKMDHKRLAELCFPHIDKTPEYYEELYPERQLPEGAKVCRMGPSPTGFMHLGNLYSAFVDERLSHQSGGVFYLRIEDTDDKRYVEGAVPLILRSLDFFGIGFDEGAGIDPETGEDIDRGAYGPYHQSERAEIYQSFAKRLVAEGKAYPCFLSEEEIEGIRAEQSAKEENIGIYGKYSPWRDASLEEVEKALSEGRPHVLRLRSSGDSEMANSRAEDKKLRYIDVYDAIRGKLHMPENYQDAVILKTNGIPTYHFAHAVDDHLMRTTHVVRGAEWLGTLPLHAELFEKLGNELPIYCHTAQLMKIDEVTGQKRKLSKRSDPELSLDFYRELGYHPAAVREYLLTILNSNFEEWRAENPEADIDEFPFSTEKMSSDGALFDMDKLNNVSKDVLLRTEAGELSVFLKKWASEFDPELASLIEKYEQKEPGYLASILNIGRSGDKPRKDLIYAGQIRDFISYFFDERFKIEDELPAEVSKEDAAEILKRYLEGYEHSDEQPAWFEKIRKIAGELGYAEKPKDYKKNPESFKGHVGHVSAAIRLAITGRSVSPDVWEIQRILGEERTRVRVKNYVEKL